MNDSRDTIKTVTFWVRWPCATLAILIGLVNYSGSATANGPFEIYGVSPRSQSSGNARTANADGWDAVHYNPAGLAHMTDTQVFLGYGMSIPQVQIIRSKTTQDEYDPVLPINQMGLSIGLGYPVPEFLEDWLYLGLAVYLPAFALTHVRMHDPAKPFMYLYDTQTDHYEATLGGSLKWTDWFKTGAGVRLGAGQRGYARTTIDPLQGTVDEQSIDAWQYSIAAPIVGATLGPLGFDPFRLSFGVTFREQVSTPLAAPVVVALSDSDASLFVPLYGDANFSPRSFNAGIAAAIEPDKLVDVLYFLNRINFSIDAQYAFWSEAPPPFIDVRVHGSGQDLEGLGLGDLLDSPREGYSRVQSPELEDTLNIKTGAEVFFLSEQLRCAVGYTWRPSPVPDQISGTNLVDSTTHILSGGLGIDVFLPPLIENPLQVDFAWQTHVFEPRTATKEDPNDPVGDWTLEGMIHLATVGLTYKY
jgi:long-subunit fatty acid transport protein